jgi:hypothetical protein
MPLLMVMQRSAVSDFTAIDGIPGPYRFYFHSFDCAEPMHVHARRDNLDCKFWLDPLAEAHNHGFRPAELRVIRRTIFQHRQRIVEAWHEHCRSARD